MDTTGKRISAARTARGWSQEELGTLLGYTQTAINYWENDKRSITVDKLIRIAHALEIPTAELLPDTPHHTASPSTAQLRALADTLRKSADTIDALLT